VLAYDYPGYGASTGAPSEAGAYAAADAAYDYATRTLGIPPERIIIHGRSLGGGVAVDLASRRPSAGLVLESTFLSASRVGFGFRPFVFERFNSVAKVSRIRCPTLVIHGQADPVIAFAHGRALFAALRVPKDSLWVPRAGHNDLALVAGDRYWTALKTFAATLPAGPHP
jgi:abhydrolase domain-containing protein 17